MLFHKPIFLLCFQKPIFIKTDADIELGASTPLMEAATEGHADMVKFLLERGLYQSTLMNRHSF